MRKIYVIIFSALTVFSGCSKVNELPEKADADNDAWKWDETLPVPIVFSTAPVVGVESKSKEGLLITSMEGEQVSVYALATVCNDNGTPADPDDDIFSSGFSVSDEDGGNGNGILMSNIISQPIQDGNITFTDDRYYPFDNSLTYSFYSYSPHTDKRTFSDDGWIQVMFNPLDGRTDILWAESHAKPYQQEGTWLYGYNSQYIRAIGGENGNLPYFHYSHKLIAFTFTASSESERDHVIATMYLDNVPTGLALNIAGAKDAAADKTPGSFDVLEKGRLYLKKEKQDGSGGLDWTLNTPLPGGSTDVLVGTVLVYIDESERNLPIIAKFNLEGVSSASLELLPPDDGFQPGNIYSYKITVHNDNRVAIGSDVDGWENGFKDLQ